MKIFKITIALVFCLAFFTCVSNQGGNDNGPFVFSKYSKLIRPPSSNKQAAEAKIEISFSLVDTKQKELAKVVYAALYNGLNPKQYADKTINSLKSEYLESVEGEEIDPEWIEMFQWEYQEEHHVTVNGSYAVITTSIYQYTGGAHGYNGISDYVFNITTPEALSLNDIITGSGFSSLKPLVMRQLRLYSEEVTGQRMKPNDPLSSGGLYLTDDVELKDWYPTAEGLCFLWNPYDISYYAAGHIQITVKWSDLKGILGPKGTALAGAYNK